MQATAGLVLVLAANSAFNGFPVLMSILARHDQMPRQLQNRGDRLAFSNGIIMLAAAAVLLLLVYQASVTRLIQLYILGVFTSFTCPDTSPNRPGCVHTPPTGCRPRWCRAPSSCWRAGLRPR